MAWALGLLLSWPLRLAAWLLMFLAYLVEASPKETFGAYMRRRFAL